MAQESTTTTLNDLLPSIVAEALFQAEENSIMRGLVRNYSLPMGSGKTITVPKYAAITAASLVEGTDLSNTEVSTDSAILTVAEAGTMVTVTDLAQRASASSVIADIGGQLGRAIARKIDRDLTALFADFTVAIGDGSAELTPADIFKAVTKLEMLGIDPASIVCVLNHGAAFSLKGGLTNDFANPNGGILQNEAMQRGFLTMIDGIPVYQSSNVLVNTGTSLGAVFSRDALGLALMQDIQIETQRDASLRATELVATATYGVGTLWDTYGIGLDSKINAALV
jgi:hypothetical protein